MAQNALQATIAKTPNGFQTTVLATEDRFLATAKDSNGDPAVPELDSEGALRVSIDSSPVTEFSRTLNITVPTVVKASAGTVGTVVVVVKGSANGTLNDCATTGAAAASNAFFALDDTATSATVLNFPTSTGIVVTPGAGQTIAISWK